MEKLNIAEILRHCPKGMELDCTLFDNVKFNYIKEDSTFPIKCFIENDNSTVAFNEYGEFNIHPKAKCVIFPRGKTTWKGFQRPFKDGDVLIGKAGKPFIFKRLNNNRGCYSYCGIDVFGRFQLESDDWTFANSLRFATEEEKQKLFDAIEANGHKWNPITKVLEDLIKPKFKVGDIIRHAKYHIKCHIINIENNKYIVKWCKDNSTNHMSFKYIEDEFELIPKFDISTLKPFDKVLVRDYNTHNWRCALYERYDNNADIMKFATIIGHYRQCIPYKGNEPLLGTTNDCDEYYKTW